MNHESLISKMVDVTHFKKIPNAVRYRFDGVNCLIANKIERNVSFQWTLFTDKNFHSDKWNYFLTASETVLISTKIEFGKNLKKSMQMIPIVLNQ